jgi:hypothetical protein
MTLSVPQGIEGESAQEVLDTFEMINVGRVQNVRVEVVSEVRAFHEIGQRYATQLRPGNVTIKGVIGRAYVNGAMLRLLLGEAANGRPAASWAQPSFNITLLTQNAAAPDVSNTVTIHEAKIDNLGIDMPEDNFVVESLNFQALYVTIADEG